MVTLTLYQPSYGPEGQPYSCRARYLDHIHVSHWWTEREALDARDKAFQDGARSVHVCGLPLRIVAGGFPRLAPLPEVKED